VPALLHVYRKFAFLDPLTSIETRYQSFDLDFVENIPTSRKRIKHVLVEIGFIEKNRYFVHPDTDFFVDFPAGPLAVGSEPVRKIQEIAFPTGRLALLSPTDCVKDRSSKENKSTEFQSIREEFVKASRKSHRS